MGIFKRSRARDAPNKRSLEDFIKGVDTDYGVRALSGAAVSEEGAMRTSAVYACVKILAETVASLPCSLLKEENGNTVKASAHPLYGVLHDISNPEMTSFAFRETMMTSLLLWGNAYARIIRGAQNHVTELWPLLPQNMTAERDKATGGIKYGYYDPDAARTVTYAPEQILHIAALSYNGITGLSPIRQAREAIGLALSTEEFGARFFSNGARPSGILEHPGTVKDPEKLRESWNKIFQGAGNSHKTAILEEGLKFHTIGIPPNDSQFLETRKYQLNEICRIFRVPPHLVADLDRSTFSNIEHQSIDFVVHTVRPWLVRWEQALFKSLLDAREKKLYFIRFNVEGLLRGDYKSRMEGYSIGRQNGWMSINDIRRLENMNPVSKAEGGDLYLVNGNMVTAAYAGQRTQKEGGID
jgi:HK97 family phage portal protein